DRGTDGAGPRRPARGRAAGGQGRAGEADGDQLMDCAAGLCAAGAAARAARTVPGALPRPKEPADPRRDLQPRHGGYRPGLSARGGAPGAGGIGHGGDPGAQPSVGRSDAVAGGHRDDETDRGGRAFAERAGPRPSCGGARRGGQLPLAGAAVTTRSAGMDETPAPVEVSLRLECPVERAFEIFTRDIGLWWPLAYTFAGDQLDTVEVRPGADGEWLERDRDGRETSWGALLAWEPPHVFAAEFAVSPGRAPEPPGRRSEVRVRFAPDGAGSRVDLEHRGFE